MPRDPNCSPPRHHPCALNAKMRLLMLAAVTSIDGVCNLQRGPRGCTQSLSSAPTMSKHTQPSCFLFHQVRKNGGASCPISWASPWSPSLGHKPREPSEKKGTGPGLSALKLWLLKVVRSGELLHRFSCGHALAGEVGPIPSKRAPFRERLAMGYATSRAKMEP